MTEPECVPGSDRIGRLLVAQAQVAREVIQRRAVGIVQLTSIAARSESPPALVADEIGIVTADDLVKVTIAASAASGLA